ncbi:MAG: GNAT family N-acetyltransferase [Bacillota bacterium]|jgi:hypothetical protein
MITKVPVENVVELTAAHQFLEAYSIMSQLYPYLSPQAYLCLLEEKRSKGYQLFALYHDTRMVALSGIVWRKDSYHHRHVFVKDLVTAKGHRCSGQDYNLLSSINTWAKENGAEYITLEA